MRLYAPRTPVEVASQAVRDLLALRGMRALTEGDGHCRILGDLLRSSGVVGPKVHDARLAAICLAWSMV